MMNSFPVILKGFVVVSVVPRKETGVADACSYHLHFPIGVLLGNDLDIVPARTRIEIGATATFFGAGPLHHFHKCGLFSLRIHV
jgi:hypothetical protein